MKENEEKKGQHRKATPVYLSENKNGLWSSDCSQDKM
jgi:hypothetical protein